jgi:hypothetical protein
MKCMYGHKSHYFLKQGLHQETYCVFCGISIDEVD